MAEVFDFEDYRTYMRAVQRKHPKTQRAITLEDWSKRLGYQSPRTVAMAMKGQRLPSRDLIEALSKDLDLNPIRKRFFELLILRDKYNKTGKKIEPIIAEMNLLNLRGLQKKLVDESKFTPIAEWYHLVIRQLARAPGFKDSAEWISARLRNKISPSDAKKSLLSLIENKFLAKDENGKYFDPEHKGLATAKDIPSVAVKRHHAQMMQRAVETLMEDSVENREMVTMTLRFDAKRVAEAKTAIREFLDTFENRFSETKSDRVYQFNVQFFEHTTTAAE